MCLATANLPASLTVNSLFPQTPRRTNFMRWYNNEHRHSRIRFVTPAERHRGLDHQVLARRHELYERAKENKPERWSGRTRNWEPIGTVLLNLDREQQNEKMAA